jgi:UDP-2,4-diacetamido-2,4,6-trideoxy-beta-L-altropyranose hydrolase
MKAMEAVQKLGDPELEIDVVVGYINPRKEEIQHRCMKTPKFYYHCQIDNMAQLMNDADLVIGAGGVSNWERCFLGLPSITIAVASNQEETTAAVAAAGATWYLGTAEKVSLELLTEELVKAISHPETLQQMSHNAFKLMGEPDRNSIVGAILGGNIAVT